MKSAAKPERQQRQLVLVNRKRDYVLPCLCHDCLISMLPCLCHDCLISMLPCLCHDCLISMLPWRYVAQLRWSGVCSPGAILLQIFHQNERVSNQQILALNISDHISPACLGSKTTTSSKLTLSHHMSNSLLYLKHNSS